MQYPKIGRQKHSKMSKCLIFCISISWFSFDFLFIYSVGYFQIFLSFKLNLQKILDSSICSLTRDMAIILCMIVNNLVLFFKKIIKSRITNSFETHCTCSLHAISHFFYFDFLVINSVGSFQKMMGHMLSFHA